MGTAGQKRCALVVIALLLVFALTAAVQARIPGVAQLVIALRVPVTPPVALRTLENAVSAAVATGRWAVGLALALVRAGVTILAGITDAIAVACARAVGAPGAIAVVLIRNMGGFLV